MPNPLKMSICRLMCICEVPWHILAQKNHWAPENTFLSVIPTDIKHEKPLFLKKSFSFFSHQHSYGWCRCPCELLFWLIVFAVLLDSWAYSPQPAWERQANQTKKKGCALPYNLVLKPLPAPYFSFLPLLFMCMSSNGKKIHSSVSS